MLKTSRWGYDSELDDLDWSLENPSNIKRLLERAKKCPKWLFHLGLVDPCG